MKKTLIIDNYDSFVYNLFQLVGKLKGHPVVFRNDKISLEDIKKESYTHIIFSPGPGSPEIKRDVGICPDIIREINLPILGVCLGFQTMAHFFGEKIISAPEIFHGKTSTIYLTKEGKKSALFKKIPSKFKVMRYHSLVSEKVPRDFTLTSKTKDDVIMSFENKDRKLFGVQFHPESFASQYGEEIVNNFLEIS